MDVTADTFKYLQNPENTAAAVFQALGAASMCWEHIENAGIFDSKRAESIGEELLRYLQGER